MGGDLASFISIAIICLLHATPSRSYYHCPKFSIYHYNGKEAILGQPNQLLYIPSNNAIVLNSSIPASIENDDSILCVNRSYQDVIEVLRCTKDVPGIMQWNLHNDYNIIKQDGYYMLVVMKPNKFLVTYTWWMYSSNTMVTHTSVQNKDFTFKRRKIKAEMNTVVSISGPLFSTTAKEISLLNQTSSEPLMGVWLTNGDVDRCYLWEKDLEGKITLASTESYYSLTINVSCQVSGSYDLITTVATDVYEKNSLVISVQSPNNTLRIYDFQKEYQGKYECIVVEECYVIRSEPKHLTVTTMDDTRPTDFHPTKHPSPVRSSDDNGNDRMLVLVIVLFIVLLCLASIIPIYKYCQQRRRKQRRREDNQIQRQTRNDIEMKEPGDIRHREVQGSYHPVEEEHVGLIPSSDTVEAPSIVTDSVDYHANGRSRGEENMERDKPQDTIHSDSIDGAKAEPVIDPFYEFLYGLSREITDDELENTKFILQLNISKADRTQITQPHELFTKMKELGILRPTDTNILIGVLHKIGRRDLVTKIDEFNVGKTNAIDTN